uniref:Sterile domain-containing protein n=1 Tax=Steinernema glaseri TaxID=37863 RepID=A0A1I7YFZ8_9BILA
MDAVPFDFIERTVILASIANVQFWPYCDGATLQGNWGRFMKSIKEDTFQYALAFFIDSNDLYYSASQNANTVRIEDLLEKKKTCLLSMYVKKKQYYYPECDKMDDQKLEMIQRLVKRSNGRTAMTMEQNLKMMPAVVAIMDAIPRVNSIHIFPYAATEEAQATQEVPAVLSFVKKHIQKRCLTRLNMRGIYPIPNTYFPLIRTFLQHSEFSAFFGKFAQKDKDFAKEVMRLIKTNVAGRDQELEEQWYQRLSASPILFNELQEEINSVEEQWPATIALDPRMAAIEPGFEGYWTFDVNFKRSTCFKKMEKVKEADSRQRTV